MGDLLGAISRHRLGLFVVAVLTFLGWLLWTGRGALPAFFIGVALAFVLDPVVTFLQRRGIPRWAGVLISYVAVVGLLWGIIALAVPPLAAQSRELVDHLPELGDWLTKIQHDFLDWYRSLPLPDDLRRMLEDAIASANQALGDAIREILAPTISALLRTAAFLIGLVVIPVWLFFVLKDREALPSTVRRALPDAWGDDATNVLGLLAITGGRWVRGQLLLGAAVGAATLIGLGALYLVGFEEFGRFALVLAVIAGILEWLPIIGPVVAAIPAVLIGLTISPAAALAAVVLYVAIQQLENHLLVPKVMGDAVDLHPAVLIVALVVGATLFGIAGAVLAAPVVAIGRDLYRYTFARLDNQPPDAAFVVAQRGRAAATGPPEAPGQSDGPEQDAAATGEPESTGEQG